MNLIYKYFYSDVARALSDALDHPEDWDFRKEFTIKHKPSDIVMWIGNGSFFFDGYAELFGDGVIPHIGLIERHFLYRKYKRVSRKLIADNIKASNNSAVDKLRSRDNT